MDKFDKPLLFFDLETTGPDTRADRIVQLGMMKINVDGTIEEKSSYINPQMLISPEAYEVHGISNEKVADSPTFDSIANGMLGFIKGCYICGYNSNAFDVIILYYEFLRAGVKWNYRNHKFIDVFSIFKHFHPRNLSYAYKLYTGDDMSEDAHDAMVDVRATWEVFKKQLENEMQGKSLDEIVEISDSGEKYADLGRFFKISESGDFIFAKGKHIDKLAKSQKPYLLWMIKQESMCETTKIIAKICLKK